MEIRSGNPYPAGALSNFAPHPFTFRGCECNSMEGFLQGLKFKDANMQLEIFKKVGIGAKRAGKNKNWQRTQTLWFQGNPIKRDSKEYQDIIDEAFEAMFTQNTKARKALLATGDATLKHSMGSRKISETVLTRREFCSRLTKIRAKLKAEDFVDF